MHLEPTREPTSHLPFDQEGTQSRAAATARLAAILAVLLAGLAQAFLTREAINPDGVAYLDIARALVASGWKSAIVGYWSPLYPLLLAGVVAAFPSSGALFAAAKIVNVIALAVALLAFAGVEQRMRRLARLEASINWVAAAYSTFAWGALVLIGMAPLTPDMLVLAFTMILVNLSMRGIDAEGRTDFVFLGIAGGFAYLAKLAMVPVVAVVFLLVAAFGSRSSRRGILTISAPVLLLVAALWVVPLTNRFERVTAGDAGRLNYVWYVNGAQKWVEWTGDETFGRPVHGPEFARGAQVPLLVFSGEFVHSTYPLWYDPAYWYDGIQCRFSWADQKQAVAFNAAEIARIAAVFWLPLVAIATVAAFALARRPDIPRPPAILALSVAGVVLLEYLAVYVEPRFISAAAVLLLLSLLSVAFHSGSAARVICAAAAALFLISFVNLTRSEAMTWSEAAERDQHIIERLHAAGIRSGDQLASLGPSFQHLSWAARAGVRFVAEVPESSLEQFKKASPGVRMTVADAAAAEGCAGFVARLNRNELPDGERWILLEAAAPAGSERLWMMPLGERAAGGF